jgi:peptidoglycan/xylan/chitin deacetylase (PgdA/CDA1 family)
MAVNLYAFDLIELDGQDLRRHPWRERRAALAKLIGGAAAGIVLSEHLDGDGAAIFRHACALGLEGIVSKRRDEKGISAVRMALGTPEAPFFRFPALKHPPELVTYLGERNIAIFSTDMDSFDFTMRRPEQVIKSVMAKLEKHGKGIVLMHDFQHPTSEALPELLNLLKGNGYTVVQMRAKEPVKTLARYDEQVAKEMKLPTVSNRPTSLVVRTISD